MAGVPVDSEAVVEAAPRAVDHVEPERIAAVRGDAWFVIGALVALLLVAATFTSPGITALLAAPVGIGLWRTTRRLQAPERWAEPDVDAIVREVLSPNGVPEALEEKEGDSLSLHLAVQDRIDALEADADSRHWRVGRLVGVGVASLLIVLGVAVGLPAVWLAALVGVLVTYILADLLLARPRRRRIERAIDRLRALLPAERAALAVACLCLAAACAPSEGDSGSTGWHGTVDTLDGGRVVVRSPDVPLEGEWTLREEFRIGSIDADGPELFGAINGLALTAEGGVLVLDGQASEIRSWDAEGRFLIAFARAGQGPGELEGADGLVFDDEGTVWLLNWGNARYTGFDPETGTLRAEHPRRAGYASFPWRGGFENGSVLVDVGLNAAGAPALLRLDDQLAPLDTLALPQPDDDDSVQFRRDGLLIASMPDPFAPRPSWTVRPRGGVVLGLPDVYRLHRVSFDADTTLTIELDREPVPVSAALRDSVLAGFDDIATNLNASPNRAPRAHASHPAYGMIVVDDEDRTWVRGAVEGDPGTVWDVFAADGRYLARVAIPLDPGFFHPVVRNGRMAVATQVDGVPTVVVYTVE